MRAQPTLTPWLDFRAFAGPSAGTGPAREAVDAPTLCLACRRRLALLLVRRRHRMRAQQRRGRRGGLGERGGGRRRPPRLQRWEDRPRRRCLVLARGHRLAEGRDDRRAVRDRARLLWVRVRGSALLGELARSEGGRARSRRLPVLPAVPGREGASRAPPRYARRRSARRRRPAGRPRRGGHGGKEQRRDPVRHSGVAGQGRAGHGEAPHRLHRRVHAEHGWERLRRLSTLGRQLHHTMSALADGLGRLEHVAILR